MAFRIGDHVVGGELSNVRRNSVTGWLDLISDTVGGAGEGGECRLRIELTGNLKGPFEGRHIRFSTGSSHVQLDKSVSKQLDVLNFRQVGAVGDMLLHTVRVPPGSVKEFYLHAKLDEPQPCDEKPCLYLEWFSQNGRVVAEIVDARVEFVNEQNEIDGEAVPEPLPDADSVGGGPDITAFSMDEDGNVHELPFSSALDSNDEDPYQIFPADLEERIDESLQFPNRATYRPDADSKDGKRSWDEVIPGIDEKTKRMYEDWDEVADGEKDEPLCTLFDPPLKLEPADSIVDEGAAESLLTELLERLATHNVAIDICDHFSALDTYRWLVEVILPEAEIHPELSRIGFTQHFSTWEDCNKCAAEFEAGE